MRKIYPLIRPGFICIFIIAAILSAPNAVGQNIKTARLKWNVSIDFNPLVDSTTSSYDSYFITQGNSVKWYYQWNGKDGTHDSKVSDMTITGTTGNWANIAVNGQMTFRVTLANGSGTLLFKRFNGQYKVLMDLIGRNGGKTNREFSVTNVAAN